MIHGRQNYDKPIGTRGAADQEGRQVNPQLSARLEQGLFGREAQIRGAGRKAARGIRFGFQKRTWVQRDLNVR